METSFGNWVRRRRKALDFTQNDLARRVGCSLSAIFKIEADERRPSLQIAERLADQLQIPADQRALFIKIARQEKAVNTLEKIPAVDPSPPDQATLPPLSHKSIVGREFEQKEITRLLMQLECRLLTLTGPGGIGKTHLAMVLTGSLAQPPHKHRVAFVNLAPVIGREQVVSAIANALGIVLYTASDRAEQLIAYLQHRKQILILDNYEHLTLEPGCIELINDLLRGAQEVKILATSRQPLELQAEWVFEVQGLPVPESDDPGKLLTNSAEALFIQRAQQADISFQPTPADLRAIAQICKLVEGLPLGIELAAAWVRSLSCVGIADEIQRSIHFLESNAVDLPERHRSIRATIEYSWKSLSSEEQKVLRELSIFRGGFQRQAAEEVTSATRSILASLVAKSLIRRVEGGRFDMHGLIQQYAQERLEEEGAAADLVWKKFSQYYAGLLEHRGGALKGAERSTVVEELITELPNLLQAWQWAARHQRAVEISQAADTLFWLYESRSNCREGVPLFDETVQCLRTGASQLQTPERQLALAQALSYKGFFLFRQGQHPQGRSALSSSLQILEGVPDQSEKKHQAISNAEAFLGMVASIMGDFDEGDRLLQEALAMKQSLNDRWGAAFCLRQIGFFAFHYRGNYDMAYQALSQSLSISKQMENTWSTAASLGQLGFITYSVGDYQQAEQHLTEALTLSRALEDRAGIAFAIDCLGLLKLAQGYHEEGQKLLQESIALWREIGEKGSLVLTLSHLGNAYLKSGSPAAARGQFLDAMRIASEMQTMPTLLDAVMGMAEVYLSEGQIETSYVLVHAVAGNPSTSYETRFHAEALKTDLEKQLLPQQVQEMKAKAGPVDLEGLVDTLFRAERLLT